MRKIVSRAVVFAGTYAGSSVLPVSRPSPTSIRCSRQMENRSAGVVYTSLALLKDLGTLSTSPTESGTHSIDGDRLTLTFGSGQVVREAFVIYGSGKNNLVNNSVIYVGSQTYTRD